MNTWQFSPALDLDLSGTARYRSVRRESGLEESTVRLIWWAAVRLWLLLAHRLEIRGLEHLPAQAPFVLAANHASHLDTLVLASAISLDRRDRVSPIEAGDVFFEKPLCAVFAATALNALPLWRCRRNCGHHALRELRQRLLDRQSIFILFPEGSRRRGEQMQAFKLGLGMLVTQTEVPIVPCYLHGTAEALPPGCLRPRLAKLHLTVGEPISFAAVVNDRPGWEEVARRSEMAVRDLAANFAAQQPGSPGKHWVLGWPWSSAPAGTGHPGGGRWLY